MIDLLALLIADIEARPDLATRVRRALGIAAPEVTVYGSRPPHEPPPGRSYRWFREHAPSMPGALRSGGKRGRSVTWTIVPSLYRVWLAAEEDRTAAPAAYVVPTGLELTDEEVDRCIAQSGQRPTRSLRSIKGGRR